MKSPSAKELLNLRTTPLAGTHGDSIFYCTGGSGLFTHFMKIGKIATSQEGQYANNQVPALLKARIDPLRVMMDFGKQHGIEVFWSLRMNDTHDGSPAAYGPILFRANPLKDIFSG